MQSICFSLTRRIIRRQCNTGQISNTILSQLHKWCRWWGWRLIWWLQMENGTSSFLAYSYVHGWPPWSSRVRKSKWMRVTGVTRLRRQWWCLQRSRISCSTWKHQQFTHLTHAQRFCTIWTFPKCLFISVEKGFQMKVCWNVDYKATEEVPSNIPGGKMLWPIFLGSFHRRYSTRLQIKNVVTGSIPNG